MFGFSIAINIYFNTNIVKFRQVSELLSQNINFWIEWWPYWEMAAILKCCVARVIFLIRAPRGMFMHILVLVSQFERLFQLSAPLLGCPRRLVPVIVRPITLYVTLFSCILGAPSSSGTRCCQAHHSVRDVVLMYSWGALVLWYPVLSGPSLCT